MTQPRRFTVVTPVFNGQGWVSDTVRSISHQSVLDNPDMSLQYILVDGGSRDSTVEEAKAAWVPRPNATMQVISEPDRGMYDALAKGLRLADGDVTAYINAGDYYSPHCLDVVRLCMSEPEVSWLTGMRVLYNSAGAIISARTPHPYDSRLIRSGHHGVRGGRFIQQESTFWRTQLHTELDLDLLASLRLAGDLYLWTRFARAARLDVVAAHLGGFRFHGGHLSDAMAQYLAEAEQIIDPARPFGRVRGTVNDLASLLPLRARAPMPRGGDVFGWDRDREAWRRGAARG